MDFNKLRNMPPEVREAMRGRFSNKELIKQSKTEKRMAQKLYGSMNLTAILTAAKAGHPAFRKADNGSIYFQVNEWINDEKDAKGNDASIQLAKQPTGEKKIYIGNLKISENAGIDQPLSTSDTSELGNIDDLPF
jgi:hypothetical protein